MVGHGRRRWGGFAAVNITAQQLIDLFLSPFLSVLQWFLGQDAEDLVSRYYWTLGCLVQSYWTLGCLVRSYWTLGCLG